jgi:hypothetical protein
MRAQSVQSIYTHLKKMTENMNDDESMDDEMKKMFVEKLKTLPIDRHEICFSIIYLHYLSTTSSPSCVADFERENSKSFVYSSLKMVRGYKFDFDKLPLKLRHMVHLYVMTWPEL